MTVTLKTLSPQSFDGSAMDMLALLFPGDPLLAIGFHADEFGTRLKSEWAETLERRKAQFIVPSAMSSRYGRTQQGKWSERCNSNVGPRQYLVVEFDFDPVTKSSDQVLLDHGKRFGIKNSRDMCACLLLHLAIAKNAPLSLVVWSGSKSLHGWFPVMNRTEEEIRTFFAYAVSIGADPATFTPSQFVRLPCGWNPKKQQKQEVIFFSPNAIPTSTPNAA